MGSFRAVELWMLGGSGDSNFPLVLRDLAWKRKCGSGIKFGGVRILMLEVK